jgi:hypothetical protein
MFIFNFNVDFTINCLKMAPIRVRFSPGILSGAGFHGEEFVPAWFSIPLLHLKIRKNALR